MKQVVDGNGSVIGSFDDELEGSSAIGLSEQILFIIAQ